MDGIWTITELAERAAAALAADGSAQVSGRVRDLPNERLIRWYTTIGLVDPPLGRRGRTALYGPRHLLQLVAVKRRQAIGRSIAEIQIELAAATDTALERIASLPSRPVSGSGRTPYPVPEAARETLQRPGPSDRPSAHAATPNRSAHQGPHAQGPATGSSADPAGKQADPAAQADLEAADNNPAAASPDARPGDLSGSTTDSTDPTLAASFTTASTGSPASEAVPRTSKDAPANDMAAAPEIPADREETTGHRGDAPRGTFWNTRPDVSYRSATVADDYGAPLPPVVQGVRLAPGATLLLDAAALNGDDLAAIQNAARPLLDTLHRRGLLVPAESPAIPYADPSRRSQ
ncbi:MerR family transcriptional regulator [Actinomadura sp. KC06]|uniref:MerR family transcriptional regulator n=1 Tax=Actinomadura sp. KC06 TaxID=2530369 RepID=UPI001FB7B7D2|nr:MerR family transcriptional regulator [Actinomadura sp. KC06]